MSARVTTWRIRPPGWPHGPLRIVMLADIHACRPWMPLGRIERLVAQANGLGGDLVALMGDYPGHIRLSGTVPPEEVAGALSRLDAPLGVFAVTGNHDWIDDRAAQRRGGGETLWHRALRETGIEVLENAHRILRENGARFAVAGLGSQRALRKVKGPRDGVDDIDAALDGIPGGTATVLLAHEPDIFAAHGGRVALTLSGHTHGGQIKLFGRTPVVPSRYGSRFVYGHVVERDAHLVVSAGLGCSGLPIRWGVPPEITVVELS